jgi:hypothetical protein
MFFELIGIISMVLTFKNNHLKEKELKLMKKKLYELNNKIKKL